LPAETAAQTQPFGPQKGEALQDNIVAHVDHGKTTLVDAVLWQTGAFRTAEVMPASA